MPGVLGGMRARSPAPARDPKRRVLLDPRPSPHRALALGLSPLVLDAGSFNKTCAKWGIVSPSAGNAAVPAKRLSRECMLLPASGRPSPLRPLDPEATLDDVYRHLEMEIRPIVYESRTGRSPPVAPAADTPAPAVLVTPRNARAASPPRRAESAPPPAEVTPATPDARRAPLHSSGGASALPTLAPMPTPAGADALPAGMLSRIMSAVRNSSDVPELTEGQLSAIFTISASAAIAAAATATPAPPNAVDVALAAAAPPLTRELSTPSPTTWVPLAHADLSASQAVAPAGKGTKRAAGAPPPPVWGTLQVALWDKVKRRRISANNYKGDIDAYLRAHPHLEVYNRQDATSKHAGNQIVAGTKLALVEGGRGEPKVVLWDTSAQSKLPPAQCPTQSGLCAFLRTHPHVEIYCGQKASAAPTATPTAADATSDTCLDERCADAAIAPAAPHSGADGKLMKATPQPEAKPLLEVKPLLSLSNCKPLVPRGLHRSASAVTQASDSPVTIYKPPTEQIPLLQRLADA